MFALTLESLTVALDFLRKGSEARAIIEQGKAEDLE